MALELDELAYPKKSGRDARPIVESSIDECMKAVELLRLEVKERLGEAKRERDVDER